MYIYIYINTVYTEYITSGPDQTRQLTIDTGNRLTFVNQP